MNSNSLEFPTDLLVTIVYLYLFLKEEKKYILQPTKCPIHCHTHLHRHFISILLPFVYFCPLDG